MSPSSLFTLYKQAGRLDLWKSLGNRLLGNRGVQEVVETGKPRIKFRPPTKTGPKNVQDFWDKSPLLQKTGPWLGSAGLAIPATAAEYSGYNPVAGESLTGQNISVSEALLNTGLNTIFARRFGPAWRKSTGIYKPLALATGAVLTTPVINTGFNLVPGLIDTSKGIKERAAAWERISEEMNEAASNVGGTAAGLTKLRNDILGYHNPTTGEFVPGMSTELRAGIANLSEGVGTFGAFLGAESKNIMGQKEVDGKVEASQLQKAMNSIGQMGRSSQSVADSLGSLRRFGSANVKFIAPAAGASLGVVLGRLLQQPLPRDASKKERTRISRRNLITSILLGLAGAGTGMAATGNNPIQMLQDHFKE